MGGKYKVSKPSSCTYGNMFSQSLKVPCLSRVGEEDRGKNSYQVLNAAFSLSAYTCSPASNSDLKFFSGKALKISSIGPSTNSFEASAKFSDSINEIQFLTKAW